MSTRSGFQVRTPPTDAQREVGRGNVCRYSCVYCKRILLHGHQLLVHEAQCDARYIVRRGWMMYIERRRRQELRKGRG